MIQKVDWLYFLWFRSVRSERNWRRRNKLRRRNDRNYWRRNDYRRYEILVLLLFWVRVTNAVSIRNTRTFCHSLNAHISLERKKYWWVNRWRVGRFRGWESNCRYNEFPLYWTSLAVPQKYIIMRLGCYGLPSRYPQLHFNEIWLQWTLLAGPQSIIKRLDLTDSSDFNS